MPGSFRAYGSTKCRISDPCPPLTPPVPRPQHGILDLVFESVGLLEKESSEKYSKDQAAGPPTSPCPEGVVAAGRDGDDGLRRGVIDVSLPFFTLLALLSSSGKSATDWSQQLAQDPPLKARLTVRGRECSQGWDMVERSRSGMLGS
jgi:hypothetical protein